MKCTDIKQIKRRMSQVHRVLQAPAKAQSKVEPDQKQETLLTNVKIRMVNCDQE